jgi:predicted transposase YbfD/YdcC
VGDDDQGEQKRKRRTRRSWSAHCVQRTIIRTNARYSEVRNHLYLSMVLQRMAWVFFQMQDARNNQIVSPAQASFAALITLETCNVSAQLIRSELARIIPVRRDWEV